MSALVNVFGFLMSIFDNVFGFRISTLDKVLGFLKSALMNIADRFVKTAGVKLRSKLM